MKLQSHVPRSVEMAETAMKSDEVSWAPNCRKEFGGTRVAAWGVAGSQPAHRVGQNTQDQTASAEFGYEETMAASQMPWYSVRPDSREVR